MAFPPSRVASSSSHWNYMSHLRRLSAFLQAAACEPAYGELPRQAHTADTRHPGLCARRCLRRRNTLKTPSM